MFMILQERILKKLDLKNCILTIITTMFSSSVVIISIDLSVRSMFVSKMLIPYVKLPSLMAGHACAR